MFKYLILITLCVYQKDDTFDEMLMKYYTSDVPKIQPSVLDEKMKSGQKVVLIDVRESAEYNVSRIPGSGIYPSYYPSALANDETGITKGDLIVLYCTIGARSEKIANRMIEEGDFTQVFNLYGGIINWSNSGYDLEGPDGKTEEVHVYSASWAKWLTKGIPVY